MIQQPCPTIDSAPGHDRDMRPISLEPVGPEGVINYSLHNTS
jgi:hypothetical protein